MPIKKTLAEIKKKFEENGLILLEQEYKNNRIKMACINNEGYKFYLSYSNISDKRVKKYDIVSVNNKYSSYNIQLFLKKNNSNSVLLSKYTDEKAELDLKCECGTLYKSNWNHISNLNNLVCPNCAEKLRHIKKMKNKTEVENIVAKSNFKLLEYVNAHNIKVEDENGYRYKTSIYNLKQKNVKFSKKNPYSFYNMKLYIEKNNLPIIVDFSSISEQCNIDIRNFYLPCVCTECSNKYFATWSQLTIDNRNRCEKCTKRQSKLETIVKEYLDINNIRYIQQKTFIGCKMKRSLPFDFYLTEYNCAIEVQGRQHYYEQKNYGRTLKEQKEYDKIKKDYCLSNDIIFIEIPYYSIKNGEYKNIIDNILG